MVPEEFLWGDWKQSRNLIDIFKKYYSVDLGPCALGIAIVIELYGFLFFISCGVIKYSRRRSFAVMSL